MPKGKRNSILEFTKKSSTLFVNEENGYTIVKEPTGNWRVTRGGRAIGNASGKVAAVKVAERDFDPDTAFGTIDAGTFKALSIVQDAGGVCTISDLFKSDVGLDKVAALQRDLFVELRLNEVHLTGFGREAIQRYTPPQPGYTIDGRRRISPAEARFGERPEQVAGVDTSRPVTETEYLRNRRDRKRLSLEYQELYLRAHPYSEAAEKRYLDAVRKLQSAEEELENAEKVEAENGPQFVTV